MLSMWVVHQCSLSLPSYKGENVFLQHEAQEKLENKRGGADKAVKYYYLIIRNGFLPQSREFSSYYYTSHHCRAAECLQGAEFPF